MISTYLLCITHNNLAKGENIIKQFNNSENQKLAKLILVENGKRDYFNYYMSKYNNINELELCFFDLPNKSASLNFAINKLINEKEALIICIDDDIYFPSNFVLRYQKIAFKKGSNFYFGGSYTVPKKLMNLIDNRYKNMYQFSQLSKTDLAFQKSKSLMFLGFNFAFFKSQWTKVHGFDERFSPGSKYGIAAQESTFQKKLMYVGYSPFLVTNNQVIHYPEKGSYALKSAKNRTIQNGYTHGFFDLINDEGKDYFLKLISNIKSLIINIIKNNKGKYVQKIYYIFGYIKALRLYILIDNKKSIFENTKFK